MGFVDFMKNIFVGNRVITVKGQIIEQSDKIYLQKMALDKVFNFVARTFSTAKFKTQDEDWDYALNVRPNQNQSASEFWRTVIYTLLFDNEALIIVTDDGQLKLADDYYKDESYELYGYTFKSVRVGTYTYERSFKMDEAIYLKYNNHRLSEITEGLFDDYGKLFALLLETVGRKGQIRGQLKINKTGSFKTVDEEQQFINGYIERLSNSFRTKGTAIIPETNGMEYKDLTNQTGGTNQNTFDDLTKLQNELTANVAEIVGVPPALIFGEKLELQDNIKLYKQFCINPLVELILDELNAKIVSEKDFKSGRRIKVSNVLVADILDMADPVYKLVSSVLTPNEIREMFGYDLSPDEDMDRHYITKNFIELDALKGGDVENENQD